MKTTEYGPKQSWIHCLLGRESHIISLGCDLTCLSKQKWKELGYGKNDVYQEGQILSLGLW